MNNALVQRLEQVDSKWLFDVVRVDVAAGEVLVFGRLTVKGTSRTAFGSCRTEGHSLADAANVAADAALAQAAAQLGIRSESDRPRAPEPLPNRNTTADPPNRLTSRQLSAIHAACRRRNMPMGELADTLAQRWGKTAPQFLTKREASELLDELSANGISR